MGLDIPRELYYRKELALHISMSYGPGRYDPEYEERGHDYPFAYVLWTEGAPSRLLSISYQQIAST